jgi:hypothetical protein
MTAKKTIVSPYLSSGYRRGAGLWDRLDSLVPFARQWRTIPGPLLFRFDAQESRGAPHRVAQFDGSRPTGPLAGSVPKTRKSSPAAPRLGHRDATRLDAVEPDRSGLIESNQ